MGGELGENRRSRFITFLCCSAFKERIGDKTTTSVFLLILCFVKTSCSAVQRKVRYNCTGFKLANHINFIIFVLKFENRGQFPIAVPNAYKAPRVRVLPSGNPSQERGSCQEIAERHRIASFFLFFFGTEKQVVSHPLKTPKNAASICTWYLSISSWVCK